MSIWRRPVLALVAAGFVGSHAVPLEAQNGCSPSQQHLDVHYTGATYSAVPPTAPVNGFFTTAQNADILLSGIDFNNSGGGLLFNHPSHLASDGTRLAMTDASNNRVLIWNTPPTSNVMPDLVLGQPDFTSNNPGTGRGQMNWPVSVSFGGGKLFVTDSYNDRLLIWNRVPTTNGATADIVIGASILSPSNPLAWPWGIWSNGTKMAASSIACQCLHVWNVVPTSDNAAPDFTVKAGGVFGSPRFLTSDGTTLMMGDHNAAVPGKPSTGTFFWTTFPTSADSAPSFFRDDPNWAPPAPPGAAIMRGTFIGSTLWAFGLSVYRWNTAPVSDNIPPDLTLGGYDYFGGEGGLAYAGGHLYVASGHSNKILGFNSLPATSSTLPDFAIGSPDICTNTLDTNYIIRNPTPRSNGSNLFVSSDANARLYVWRNLPDQSNAHPDLVYDLPFQPWGIDVHDNVLALGGYEKVYIWESLPLNGEMPTRKFSFTIGNVTLKMVRGVAYDGRYFYVADQLANKIYVWRGLPSANSNPAFALDLEAPGRLSSDGVHLVVTQFQTIAFYDVTSLNATSTPTIMGGMGTWRFNGPLDVSVSFGRLFVADVGFYRVKAWSSIANAIAGADADVALGNTNDPRTLAWTPEIGRNKLFWPGGVSFDGHYLWVGEFKFSGRLLRFSASGSACSYAQSSSTQSMAKAGGAISIGVTAGSGCPWIASSDQDWITVTGGAIGSGTGTVSLSVAANAGAARIGTLMIAGSTYTVTQAGLATMSVSPSTLTFGATSSGGTLSQTTAAQTVTLSQTGASAAAWTVSSDQSWLTLSPASGVGAGTFNVTINNTGGVLPASGTVTATVTVALTGPPSPSLALPVSLTVTPTGQTQAPFGVFDTPADGATGLQGSFAVTGWALDDVGIDRVEIWRDLAADEDPTHAYTTDPSHPAFGKVFVANPLFVKGSRTDVEGLYPALPFANRAGWGYLLLSWGLHGQGNGTYKLYAYAFDVEAHSTLLGTKTIGVDNTHATKPFGAIDTPSYGGTVSGSIWNFGWALTPNASPLAGTAGAATCLIINGSVTMDIDSGAAHVVNYGDLRTDIAASFPGFTNGNNSGGAFYLDTTTLSNGVHQIGWLVYDSCGRGDGIGSRFFTVLNGSTDAGDAVPPGETPGLKTRPTARREASGMSVGRVFRPGDQERSAVTVRQLGGEWQTVSQSTDGAHVVEVAQDGRVEVQLPPRGSRVYAGRQVFGKERRALPLGSSLDGKAGIFYWRPAAGFLGKYDLAFASEDSGEVRVRVVVGPPIRAAIDTPQWDDVVDQTVTLAGWALDLAAEKGSGIDTVHVWAYPLGDADPIFVGIAAYGDTRKDVGKMFGESLANAAYSLTVDSLPPGTYDVVVYPHRSKTNTFEGAQVVRVVVK